MPLSSVLSALYSSESLFANHLLQGLLVILNLADIFSGGGAAVVVIFVTPEVPVVMVVCGCVVGAAVTF